MHTLAVNIAIVRVSQRYITGQTIGKTVTKIFGCTINREFRITRRTLFTHCVCMVGFFIHQTQACFGIKLTRFWCIKWVFHIFCDRRHRPRCYHSCSSNRHSFQSFFHLYLLHNFDDEIPDPHYWQDQGYCPYHPLLAIARFVA